MTTKRKRKRHCHNHHYHGLNVQQWRLRRRGIKTRTSPPLASMLFFFSKFCNFYLFINESHLITTQQQGSNDVRVVWALIGLYFLFFIIFCQRTFLFLFVFTKITTMTGNDATEDWMKGQDKETKYINKKCSAQRRLVWCVFLPRHLQVRLELIRWRTV